MWTRVLTIGTLVPLLSLTPPDQDSTGSPAKGERPVLSGPKVETARTQPTLVEREFGGKLKRLDVDPAQAALGLLELSEKEKDGTSRVLIERAAIMDTFVTDHLREVAETANAFQAQDWAGGLRLLNELMDKAHAWRARGKLEDELAATLTEANAAELRRLTREYVSASLAELAEEPGTNGKPRGRLAAVALERLTVLGHEIRQSYERTIGAGAKDIESLLKRLGVTPEQESVIRAVIQETYVATYGKPTKTQQTIAFLKIYGALDSEQRKELAKYIGEQRGGRSGSPAEQQNSK
jgi:hypothetical protein